MLSCDSRDAATTTDGQAVTTEDTATRTSTDEQQLLTLTRGMLYLVEANSDINLLPLQADSNGSLFIGIDTNRLNANVEELCATGFFTEEFVQNYRSLVATIQEQFKKGEIEPFPIGEMPPISFATEADPWTMCQDLPYDDPKSWDLVTIEIKNIAGDHAEYVWKWGGLGPGADPGWKDFTYDVKAVKEDGRWKISYLEGFRL